ncbi:putative urease accessory protein UreD [Helianthus annuus]|nr:putative urease accessory protein UreD [Helianthus annuus]
MLFGSTLSLMVGDCISFDITVEDDCTAVLTTQASTKVYKSVALKCSEQIMEASIGNGGLLVVIPDPVTCFSTAKYSQKQVLRIMSGSSLLVVDWITSGRHESGEKWDFILYKSTNHIYIMETKPLFLDTHIQNQIQEDVKKIMSEQLSMGGRTKAINGDGYTKPPLVASCNSFGPKVLLAFTLTSSVNYAFLC